ncbi:MAG: hypothetical protein AABX01_03415 [Candidatus Micrarchaeota archaeon]
MSKKAQFSFDLMVVISIMLLLFLGLFQFYIGKAEGASITRQKLSAKSISDTLASRMDSVLQAGNGTESKFSLPQTLSDGENYTIEIVGRRVDVVFNRASVSSLLSSSDLLSVDLNARKGTEIEISSIGGKIYLK